MAFTTREAAAILKVSPRTLEDWRMKKVGPDFVRVQGECRYPEIALQDWLAKQAVLIEPKVAA